MEPFNSRLYQCYTAGTENVILLYYSMTSLLGKTEMETHYGEAGRKTFVQLSPKYIFSY